VKYEVRMTIEFARRINKPEWNNREWFAKSTVIDYIDAVDVAEAYIKAGKLKHDTAIKITSSLDKETKIAEVAIDIDAVVAKPELTFMLSDEERRQKELRTNYLTLEKSIYDPKTDTFHLQTEFGILNITATFLHALMQIQNEITSKPEPSTPEPKEGIDYIIGLLHEAKASTKDFEETAKRFDYLLKPSDAESVRTRRDFVLQRLEWALNEFRHIEAKRKVK